MFLLLKKIYKEIIKKVFFCPNPEAIGLKVIDLFFVCGLFICLSDFDEVVIMNSFVKKKFENVSTNKNAGFFCAYSYLWVINGPIKVISNFFLKGV